MDINNFQERKISHTITFYKCSLKKCNRYKFLEKIIDLIILLLSCEDEDVIKGVHIQMFWNKKTINTEMIHFINYAMNDIYSLFNEIIPIIIFIVRCIYAFPSWTVYGTAGWLKLKTAQRVRGFSIEKPSRWGCLVIIQKAWSWTTALQ